MMDPVQTINLGQSNQEEKTKFPILHNLKNILSLAFILFLITALTLSAGYLWGRFKSLPETSLKSDSTNKLNKSSEQNLFEDKENGIQINYPKDWAASKKTSAIPGVTIAKEKNSVELWLSVDQPVSFSAEQQAAHVTTNKLDLKIGSQTAKMTEYIYTAGNYFSIVSLSATKERPLVTFWIIVEDQENYSKAKNIVQSFSFK